MHSTQLRGGDFRLEWQGESIPHADFFRGLGKTDRLGIHAPRRYEGAGVVTLVMAYMTAFYDRYREDGVEFVTYPEFFTFQQQQPIADYSMFDISPKHKNVLVPDTPIEMAGAITDRGVNVLLVPDENVRESTFEDLQMESARRNVGRCFAYAPGGEVATPDLVIECNVDPFKEYVLAMFDSVPDDPELQRQRGAWLESLTSTTLRQSFREISLSEALRRL